MILILFVQLHEISAPSPYSYDQIVVIFRVLLGIQHGIPVYRVDLHLMPSQIDIGFYQSRNLGDAFLSTEQSIVQLNGERAAIDYPG